MESRLLQQERLAQESESRAAQMEARILELQRMLEGAPRPRVPNPVDSLRRNYHCMQSP